jgi:DNA-binding MarR family transcriptional regulator
MDFEHADQLNEAIRAVAMRHRALAGALLAPLGLHPGQEILLLALDAQGPRTQAQLAAASGCEPPTITHSVRKLEAAGLVVRRPSTADGRVTIVELSDLGRQLVPRLRATWQELAERTTSRLSMPLDELMAGLAGLAEGLDDSPPVRRTRACAPDPPPPTPRTGAARAIAPDPP